MTNLRVYCHLFLNLRVSQSKNVLVTKRSFRVNHYLKGRRRKKSFEPT